MYDSHEVKEQYNWRATVYDAACAAADSEHVYTPEEYFAIVQEAMKEIHATPPYKRELTWADLEDLMSEVFD